MPTESNDLDIAVRNAPGSRSAPVGSGGVAVTPLTVSALGAYYEWRGRPIVFPNPAILNGVANPAFVPRARLNWRLSIYHYNNVSNIPGFLLSRSIINNLDSTESGGPVISATAFPDPSYGPTIRLLTPNVESGSSLFVVHFDLMEPKDEDRDPNGI
jgi:hypothetical protein